MFISKWIWSYIIYIYIEREKENIYIYIICISWDLTTGCDRESLKNQPLHGQFIPKTEVQPRVDSKEPNSAADSLVISKSRQKKSFPNDVLSKFLDVEFPI